MIQVNVCLRSYFSNRSIHRFAELPSQAFNLRLNPPNSIVTHPPVCKGGPSVERSPISEISDRPIWKGHSNPTRVELKIDLFFVKKPIGRSSKSFHEYSGPARLAIPGGFRAFYYSNQSISKMGKRNRLIQFTRFIADAAKMTLAMSP